MPPSPPNEQEIQFKKRARRRLVGAIALVLLMVTVLPMLLDDRAAKTQQQEIAITIPSQDGTDFTSKVVPVVPVKPLPASDLGNLPDNKSPPVDMAKDLSQATQKTPIRAAAPVAKAELTQKPDVIKPEVVKHQAVPLAPAQVGKGEGFVVQIGVFSDAENVKNLQRKLETLGYKSYAEKIPTPKGEKIRLRTASFPDRAKAENALIAIKDSGLSGMVVQNKQDY